MSAAREPNPVVPTLATATVQAAIRGHQDRIKLKARASWMADRVQSGDLTPRALGDANGTRPRALMGVDTSVARRDAQTRAAASRAASSVRIAAQNAPAPVCFSNHPPACGRSATGRFRVCCVSCQAGSQALSLSERRRQERRGKSTEPQTPQQMRVNDTHKRADQVASRQLRDFLVRALPFELGAH